MTAMICLYSVCAPLQHTHKHLTIGRQEYSYSKTYQYMGTRQNISKTENN